MTNEQTEQTTDEPRYVSIPGALATLGLVLWIASGVTFMQQRSGSDGRFSDAANYAPSLLLVGAGCYVVLLAAVLSLHRRD